MRKVLIWILCVRKHNIKISAVSLLLCLDDGRRNLVTVPELLPPPGLPGLVNRTKGSNLSVPTYSKSFGWKLFDSTPASIFTVK